METDDVCSSTSPAGGAAFKQRRRYAGGASCARTLFLLAFATLAMTAGCGKDDAAKVSPAAPSIRARLARPGSRLGELGPERGDDQVGEAAGRRRVGVHVVLERVVVEVRVDHRQALAREELVEQELISPR